MKFAHPRISMEISAGRAPFFGPGQWRIVVEQKTIDRASQWPLTVFDDILVDEKTIKSEEELEGLIRAIFHRMAAHEIDEWLMVEGKRKWDPHAGETEPRRAGRALTSDYEAKQHSVGCAWNAGKSCDCKKPQRSGIDSLLDAARRGFDRARDRAAAWWRR